MTHPQNGQPREAWAILDVPPNNSHPNGFSSRWESFLAAVSLRFSLRIFAIHEASAYWPATDFQSPRFANASLHVECVRGNPIWLNGSRGKIARLRHYALDKVPANAYPVRLEALDRLLTRGAPSIVLSFLPANIHLLRQLADKAPSLVMLEEGFERAIPGKGRAGLQGWAANRETRLIHETYAQTGALIDRAVVISNTELEWFARFIPRRKLVCLEHAIDCEHFVPRNDEERYDVAVFGDMSTARNYEAARSLFDFMEGRSETRGLRWAFVGRSPHRSLLEIAGANVTVTGFVDDLRPYYSTSRVVVVPGVIGTGVKTTVLQAWGMGRPVVATSPAVRGIRHSRGVDVLIGDSLDGLAGQIRRLLENPDLAERVGSAGRQTVCRSHDLDSVAGRFADLCEEVARERRAVRHPIARPKKVVEHG